MDSLFGLSLYCRQGLFSVPFDDSHSIGPVLLFSHTKVKPRSKRSTKTATSIQVGVECYGGGLWYTWFDRDLGLSGRVFVSDSTGTENAGSPRKIRQELIKINRAILRIPNLAIHLQSAEERTAFKVNNEDHLSPILAMAAEKALTNSGEDDDNADAEGGEKKKKEKEADKDGWSEYQEPLLLQLLATELGVNVKDILDFELNLFDVQPASLGGVHSEFIHSSRLDNLASCFLAVQALVDHVQDDNGTLLAKDQDISMVVLYDHEEVGSNSA
jgi:aspartyl aminopeptidase